MESFALKTLRQVLVIERNCRNTHSKKKKKQKKQKIKLQATAKEKKQFVIA